jgi:hypothetical protein
MSSTPGAADIFRPKKLARRTTVNVMQERRQLALPALGDGFSYAGLRLSSEERTARAGVLSGSIGPES